MRARKYIIGGLILWALLIVFLIINSFYHRPKQVNLYRATPVGANIRFPYLAGPHTVDFFTGSGFAAYDTETQTSKNISPQFILPTVSEVRWSKTGVLFKTSDYTVADDLFAAFPKIGLVNSQEYWWLYNFATQKLTVVMPNPPHNVVDALWNSPGNNYCYISTDGSLYLSTAPGQALDKVPDGTRIKQCSGTKITLSEGTILKQINTADHSSKTLVNTVFQDSYVSPDGKTIAYVLNTHPKSGGVVPGDLYKVDPGNGKSHKILSGFSGAMAGGGGDLYAGYADPQDVNQLWLFPKSGKTIRYSLGLSLNHNDIVGNILPVNSQIVYIVSKSNTLIEVTNQYKNVSTPISYKYKIQTDLYENGFEIHYNPYKDTYEVDITATPYFTYQAAALQYIRAQTVDPNQINIIWRAGEGVDKTNPAVDTTRLPGLSGE